MSAESPVSGTRHPDGSRNWKAINANRRTSKIAKQAGVSRYQLESIMRLQKLTGDEFTERIRQGKLTTAQAWKIVRDRTIADTGYDDIGTLKLAIAMQKIRKHWKCLLAAAREYGIPEEDRESWIARMIPLCLEPDTQEAA
jgi:hypothetical protein